MYCLKKKNATTKEGGWLRAKEEDKEIAAEESQNLKQEMRSNLQNTSRETFFKYIRSDKTGNVVSLLGKGRIGFK